MKDRPLKAHPSSYLASLSRERLSTCASTAAEIRSASAASSITV
jgi:hypothetical protein